MQILVDTNFWLIPGQFRVDIFAEFERLCGANATIHTLSASIDELTKLTKDAKNLAQRTAAKLGLQLIKQKKITIIPVNHAYADDAIVKYVRDNITSNPIGIATQDAELKSRLKPLGVSFIVLRARTHLEFIKQSYK